MDGSGGDRRFTVEFQQFPVLVPQRMDTQFPSGFLRWRGAAAIRTFTLQQHWTVELQVDPADFDGRDFSGRIVIPICYAGKHTILDGASVPLPWLVSFLSFGLLRPVGVMLTASIVHDFAFQHGVLPYRREGFPDPVAVEIERHHADLLFARMITEVNGMPLVGSVGWLAVRLGWLWVPYGPDRRRRGGPAPWRALAVLAAVVAGGVVLALAVGPLLLATVGLAFYLLAYLLLGLLGPPRPAAVGPSESGHQRRAPR